MSLRNTARSGLGGASCAALLFVAAAPALAQSPVPQGQPAQAAPAKAVKAPVKAKAAPANQEQDAGSETQAAVKKKDPAAASQSIDSGIKLLQSGKAEQAIQTFTVAIGGGNMPPPQMARALYHRGVAYRKVSKPAQAISDLTSALWLKNGLQDADRQDAVKQRADAYREAGLPDQTGEDGRPAGSKQTGQSTRSASAGEAPIAAPSSVTTASLAPTPQTAPSTGGLFANLFGGFNKPAAPAVEPQPQAKSAAPQAVTSGWSSATATPSVNAAAAPPPAAARAAAKAQTAPVKTASLAPSTPPATQAGPAAAGIHARIALVRTDAEADSVRSRLINQHADALAGLTPTTSVASFGGMGAFVQVRVGPYANLQQAQGLCAKLKGSGLDCVPVDR